MLGIIKAGIILKVIFICALAAGAAYLGRAITRTAPPTAVTPETQEVAAEESARVETGPLHSFHRRVNGMSPFWRIIIFVVIAFLLPLATMSIVKRVLAERSNKYNFLMLAGYTAFDILLALVLIGILLTDFWAYLLFICAVTGSAAYNFAILTQIQEIEQES
jgi:hypothetical protein